MREHPYGPHFITIILKLKYIPPLLLALSQSAVHCSLLPPQTFAFQKPYSQEILLQWCCHLFWGHHLALMNLTLSCRPSSETIF